MTETNSSHVGRCETGAGQGYLTLAQHWMVTVKTFSWIHAESKHTHTHTRDCVGMDKNLENLYSRGDQGSNGAVAPRRNCWTDGRGFTMVWSPIQGVLLLVL